jgi:hypothetical protein
VSADQATTYTPKPVTQRDGSKLASSNCRMASICTGLDYDTRGGKTSTGGRMRTYTTDQSGGTDSGDAKEAWSKGYAEALTVRDGKTFDDLLADLRAGRLVHIDVWHATTGQVCLSGGGGYGHTMAVLPDCQSNAWLVSDPWCSPPKWARVSESKLRAGAEEWGRRIYGQATGGRAWSGNEAGLINAMRMAARRHMERFHVDGPEDDTPDPDTGGGGRIMFTVTVAQPLKGDDVAGTMFESSGGAIGELVTKRDVGIIPTHGGDYYPVETGWKRNVYQTVVIGDGKYAGSPAYLVKIPGGAKDMGLVLASAATYTPFADPAPIPPPADCSTQVAAAVRERDEKWQENLMKGLPWPTVETAGDEEVAT